MKKLLIGAVVALLPLTGMAATVLGFQVGVGSWSQKPTGSLTTTIGSDTLSGATKTPGYTYFALEHPVPIVPNLKYANTKISTAGTSIITLVSLEQTDTTLYYEILDNVVSLDIGITSRNFSGQFNTSVQNTTLSGPVPLLYASAEIELPAGLNLSAEINTISAGANTISDVTAKISYTTDFMLGIEAGIRTQNIKIDVSNEKLDMKFSGAFAGIYYKF